MEDSLKKLTCFKAYDIRGKLGEELNTEIAYRIGRAYVQHLQANKVVLGGDIRATSEELKLALAQGIMDAGADVIDLGLTGTEQVYFAAFHLDVDGGIEVTASHNPIDYNGMKLVGRSALPISGDSGLKKIQNLAEVNKFVEPKSKGSLTKLDLMDEYTTHLLTYINPNSIKPLKLVVNSGNGTSGPVIDALEKKFQKLNIPISFIKVHHQPDSSFPNGIPNPLLPENRSDTSDAVKQHQADFGIAWDGDFDRCFLFDEAGVFIEGYYLVGLLAETLLDKHPGSKIIHDPRLTWNTIEQVKQAGGIPIQSKTGHAFIKERMRQEDAIYGGEMSSHHYFKDFAYCDSGMIPWLLIAELVSKKEQSLSELVAERIAAYPCSGEINYTVDNTEDAIQNVLNHFIKHNPNIDKTDGISLEFSDWRMNLRTSNTEPLLRMNIEAKSNTYLVKNKVTEVQNILSKK